MNWGRVKALLIKDLSLYFRNRFIAVITVIGMIFYIVLYFVMPENVNENLNIGVYVPIEVPGITTVEAEGLAINMVESDELLQEGVIEGDYVAGIAMPDATKESLASGLLPDITLYVSSDVPGYVKDSVTAVIEELAYQSAGEPLSVSIDEEIIGEDMAGMQIPPRDRIRPMLAIFLIMFETFGLANLIAEELVSGTARAILLTPLSVKELFTGKGLFGILLAFTQSVIFMGIVGGFSSQPLIIITALLLGSIMATGVGFLIGALARDFMSVLAWGMILFIILLVPSFGIMFPGAVTGWIEYIPSYYLVDMVHRAAGFSTGWSDLWLNIIILIGFSAITLSIGALGIRRRAQ